MFSVSQFIVREQVTEYIFIELQKKIILLAANKRLHWGS